MGTGDKNYQAPDYITAEFLQDVLKEYFMDETVEVRELIVRSATGHGKGYGNASEMHRATFNLIRKDVAGKFSVIIKAHPDGPRGVIARKNELFKREILAYKEVLPRIETLLASIGDNTKIAPACYYTTETPDSFLVLEDMELSGFESFERKRLLNLDFVMQTVEKLAKVHACSAALAESNPEVMDFFKKAPITADPEVKKANEFFPVLIRTAASEVARWPGYEEITEKLYLFAENVLDGLAEMYEAHNDDFRVFSFADLWIDNLLFKINHETKTADDVVFLDFQLAYFGTPGLDLNYFLYGSMNENVRKVHIKYILHTYQRILKETLEKLNYTGYIPTLKAITIDMIRNSLQGVVAATCLAPLILSEVEGPESWKNLYASTPSSVLPNSRSMQHKQSRPAFTGGGYISSPSRRFGPPTVGMAVSSRDVGSSAAYRVGDFMTKKGNLQVLKPSTTVHQALEVLVEKSLSGFLVIDDDWKLVGVVSDYDLLALHVISGVRVEEMNIFPDVNSSWKRFKEMQKLLSKTNGEVVADLMTPAPLVVREATNLESAARVLLETKLHRLPVVDCDGKLVGVITREDIVRAGLHIKRTHQS